jgi:hypothetical protein
MVIFDKTYTLEEFNEFAAQYPEHLFELIDGRIVEKVTAEEQGSIAGNIVAELRAWKKSKNIQGYIT